MRKVQVSMLKICLFLLLIALTTSWPPQSKDIKIQLDQRARGHFGEKSSLSNFLYTPNGNECIYTLGYESGLSVTYGVTQKSIYLVQYKLGNALKNASGSKWQQSCAPAKPKIQSQAEINAYLLSLKQINSNYVLISFSVLQDGYYVQYQWQQTLYTFELTWDLRIRRKQSKKIAAPVDPNEVSAEKVQQILNFLNKNYSFKISRSQIQKIQKSSTNTYILIIIVQIRGRQLRYTITLRLNSTGKYEISQAKYLIDFTPIYQVVRSGNSDESTIRTINQLVRNRLGQKIPQSARLTNVQKDEPYYRLFFTTATYQYMIQIVYDELVRKITIVSAKGRQITKPSPIAGGVQILSKTQYMNNENYIRINDKLRMQINLIGYQVVQVSQQVVNGLIYVLTYRNKQGNTIVFTVHVSTKGDITVQNTVQKLANGSTTGTTTPSTSTSTTTTTTSPSTSSPTITIVPSTPVIAGGVQTLSKQQYTNNQNFKNIYSKLIKQYRNILSGYQVFSVSQQVVSGYIYVIIFKNALGDTITYTVYVSPTSDITIQSTKHYKQIQTIQSTIKNINNQYNTANTANTQYNIIPLNTTPINTIPINTVVSSTTQPILTSTTNTVITGGFHIVPKQQYSNNNEIVSVDSKLKKQYNMGGYELVQVSQQIVSGTNYRMTYRNKQGYTIVYTIYVTLNGDISVQGATKSSPTNNTNNVNSNTVNNNTVNSNSVSNTITTVPTTSITTGTTTGATTTGSTSTPTITSGSTTTTSITTTPTTTTSTTTTAPISTTSTTTSTASTIPSQPTTTTITSSTTQSVVQNLGGYKQVAIDNQQFLIADTKLRQLYDLSTYHPTRVLQQLVNGFNYIITYVDKQGHTLIYQFYITFQGQLTINNIKRINNNSNSSNNNSNNNNSNNNIIQDIVSVSSTNSKTQSPFHTQTVKTTTPITTTVPITTVPITTVPITTVPITTTTTDNNNNNKVVTVSTNPTINVVQINDNKLANSNINSNTVPIISTSPTTTATTTTTTTTTNVNNNNNNNNNNIHYLISPVPQQLYKQTSTDGNKLIQTYSSIALQRLLTQNPSAFTTPYKLLNIYFYLQSYTTIVYKFDIQTQQGQQYSYYYILDTQTVKDQHINNSNSNNNNIISQIAYINNSNNNNKNNVNNQPISIVHVVNNNNNNNVNSNTVNNNVNNELLTIVHVMQQDNKYNTLNTNTNTNTVSTVNNINNNKIISTMQPIGQTIQLSGPATTTITITSTPQPIKSKPQTTTQTQTQTQTQTTTQIKSIPQVDVIGNLPPIRVLSKPQFTTNPYINKINNKLRKQYALNGYQIDQITQQIQPITLKNMYAIRYKDKQGNLILIIIVFSPNGQITVDSVKEVKAAQVKRLYSNLQSTTNVVSTTQQQPTIITTQQTTQQQPTIITKQQTTQQLTRQPIQQTTTVINTKQQQPTIVTSPSTSSTATVTQTLQDSSSNLVGAAKTLSKLQFTTNTNVVNIDSKLRKQYKLSGYQIVDVTEQVVKGTMYVITYKDKQGNTIIIIILLSPKGQINVQSVKQIKTTQTVTTTTSDVTQTQQVKQVKQPQQQTINTSQSSYTVSAPSSTAIITSSDDSSYVKSIPKIQFTTNQNILNIDSKLRRQYKLNGYDIFDVTQQTAVKGTIFVLRYKNAKNDVIVIIILLSPRGDITVQNVSEKKAQSVITATNTPIPNIIPGQTVTQTTPIYTSSSSARAPTAPIFTSSPSITLTQPIQYTVTTSSKPIPITTTSSSTYQTVIPVSIPVPSTSTTTPKPITLINSPTQQIPIFTTTTSKPQTVYVTSKPQIVYVTPSKPIKEPTSQPIANQPDILSIQSYTQQQLNNVYFFLKQTVTQLSFANSQIYRLQKFTNGYRIIFIIDSIYYQFIIRFNTFTKSYKLLNTRKVSQKQAQSLQLSTQIIITDVDEQLKSLVIKAVGKQKIGVVHRISQIRVRMQADGFYYDLIIDTESGNQYQVQIYQNSKQDYSQIISYQQINEQYYLSNSQLSQYTYTSIDVSDTKYKTNQVLNVLTYINDKFGALFSNHQLISISKIVIDRMNVIRYKIVLKSTTGIYYQLIAVYNRLSSATTLLKYQKLYNGYAIAVSDSELNNYIMTFINKMRQLTGSTYQVQNVLVNYLSSYGRVYKFIFVGKYSFALTVFVPAQGTYQIYGIQAIPTYYRLLISVSSQSYGSLNLIIQSIRNYLSAQTVTVTPTIVTPNVPSAVYTPNNNYNSAFNFNFPTNGIFGNNFIFNMDFNCVKSQGDICLQCVYRFYPKNGKCVAVPDSCTTYDSNTGECLTCYNKYYLSQGTCKLMGDLCIQADSNGRCLKCYADYSLVNGECYNNVGYASYSTSSSSNLRKQTMDSLCEQYQNGVCKKCTAGAYLSTKIGCCTLRDPYAQQFDQVNENILSCVRGYKISMDGKCVRAY